MRVAARYDIPTTGLQWLGFSLGDVPAFQQSEHEMSTKHTEGPWLIATSNSWRRIVSQSGESVCEPIKQNDGHPDLYFRNGGADGPDARLLAAAPDLLKALQMVAAGLGAPLRDYELFEVNAAIAKATLPD